MCDIPFSKLKKINSAVIPISIKYPFDFVISTVCTVYCVWYTNKPGNIPYQPQHTDSDDDDDDMDVDFFFVVVFQYSPAPPYLIIFLQYPHIKM